MGRLLLHDAEEGLLHEAPRDVPEDQAVLLDQVAVAGAEGGGLTGLVDERHRALDDGRMLGKREVDQNVAAGCLEDAGGGDSVAVVDARRDLRITGHHRPAEVPRRPKVHQVRLRYRVAFLVNDHPRGWMVLRRSVEERFLNEGTPHLPEDDAALRDKVAVAFAEMRAIPPLVGELDFAAEDGGVFGEREIDEHRAGGSL